MSREWKAGDVAWFADEKVVYQAEIVRMSDGNAYTEASEAERYSFSPLNIFETQDAAERANARWHLENAIEWSQDGGADPAQAEAKVTAALDRWTSMAVAAAIASERATVRKWLGQQAVKAERESRGFGDRATIAAGKRAAFKQAADHLKPARKVTK